MAVPTQASLQQEEEEAAPQLGQTLSRYCYIGLAQFPSVINCSVIANFTKSTDLNLIVSKLSILEIYVFNNLRLELHGQSLHLYARIADMLVYRPEGYDADLLYVLTERSELIVLEWCIHKNKCVTRSMGNYLNYKARPPYEKQMLLLDDRTLCLHTEKLKFQIIHLGPEGNVTEPWVLNVDEWEKLTVIDAKLYRNVLAVLAKEENTEDAFMLRYLVSEEHRSYSQKLKIKLTRFSTESLLIPVVLNGNITFFVAEANRLACVTMEDESLEFEVLLHDAEDPQLDTPLVLHKIHNDERRILVADCNGKVQYLEIIVTESNGVHVKVKTLTSNAPIASTLSFLTEDTVFVGSLYGDSQVLKFRIDDFSSTETREAVPEILQTFESTGPLLDYTMVSDKENPNFKKLVTVSGAFKEGSISVFQHGIEVTKLSELTKLSPVVGLWCLKDSYTDPYEKYILPTFVDHTKIYELNQFNQLAELDHKEFRGLIRNKSTLYSADLPNNLIIQVTEETMQVLHGPSGEALDGWKSKEGLISVTASGKSKVIVAYDTGLLALVQLHAQTGAVTELISGCQMPNDVSCLAVSPNEEFAAVGTWHDNCVRILDLKNSSSLFHVVSKLLPRHPHPDSHYHPQELPRSLIFYESKKGEKYILMSAAHGRVVKVDFLDNGELYAERTETLCQGSLAGRLSKFDYGNDECVLFQSNPCILLDADLQQSKTLLFHDLPRHISGFHVACIPNGVVYYTRGGTLAVGSVADCRAGNLILQKVKLGEHVRRICYQKETSTFLICTDVGEPDPNSDTGFKTRHYVKMLDDNFTVLDSYELDFHGSEYGLSIVSMKFKEDDINMGASFVVGTAVTDKDEEEPRHGRILLMVASTESKLLQCVSTRNLNGGANCMVEYQGYLIASCNSSVCFYGFKSKTFSLDLRNQFQARKFVVDMDIFGDVLLTCDLMKSVTLFKIVLEANAEEVEVQFRCHDFSTRWMSCGALLDQNTVLASEYDSMGLIIARQRQEFQEFQEIEIEEMKKHMHIHGNYHLGDMPNVMHCDYLSLSYVIDPWLAQHVHRSLLFITPLGSVGVVAGVDGPLYRRLQSLQAALCRHAPVGLGVGLGQLEHSTWRSVVDVFGEHVASSNFVDGALLGHFLQLGLHDQRHVALHADLDPDIVIHHLKKLASLH